MRPLSVAAGGVAIFVALGLLLPDWLVFILSLALAKGLVVLGVVLLMQAGLVSFGQGLFFAAGAYAVGFALKYGLVQEAFSLTVLAILVGLGLAALTGLLIARYREIFFAMLTLAFSMVLYGILVRAYGLTGGTDGVRIPPPTLLGVPLPGEQLRLALYLYTLGWTALVLALVYRYASSPLGYTVRAIRDNELRVAYLGVSVERAIYLTFVLAGGLAGLSGALVAFNVGHADPALSYWTTSGEFVFVALLGGIGSIFAPLLGSIVFELARTYAFKYTPYTWQLILGVVMLLIILFLPRGLWTLYESLRPGRPRWTSSSKPSG